MPAPPCPSPPAAPGGRWPGPAFLTGVDSLLTVAGGPIVRLEGESSAMMVQIWFQPGDAASFVARLRAEGVKELG
jgi:hypothetical protein